MKTAAIPSPAVVEAAVANRAVLQQGLALLAALGPERYAERVPVAFRSSCGGHFRHIIDHYESLLEGLEPGRVDYEHRARDRSVETDAAVARARLEAILERLDALIRDGVPPGSLLLRSECAGEEGEAWNPTSAGRELEFLLSHTVHHFALVAVMARLLGVEPEPDFGMAPSTLRHQQAAARS